MTQHWDLAPGSIAPYSEHEWLIGCSTPKEAQQLARGLLASGSLVHMVTLGLRSVMVRLDPALDQAALRALCDQLPESVASQEGRRHQIDVALDGEDVTDVCARTGLDLGGLTAEVERQDLEVGVVGFSPGFGYLTGLSGPLSALERRASPRARVPAGSLAIAAGMAAIYPSASPGGWWLIGHTDAVMFDAERDSPALLAPGDRVSFSVAEALTEPVEVGARRSLRIPRGVAAAIEVTAAPPGTSIVDQGRDGSRHLGVPRGGPKDHERSSVVRALVGGAPAAIELMSRGLGLTFLTSTVIALIDATGEIDGRSIPSGVPVAVSGGQQLEIVTVSPGLVGYLAFAGGPIVEPVLGSMSTDSLSGLGPGFLEQGDLLGGEPVGPRRLPARGSVPADRSPAVLRITRGPHHAVLEDPEALDGFASRVSKTSNRVGVRLEPESTPLLRHAGEIDSCPMVIGAIQLPPNGEPVVLGPDHATLGGYPVVAVVIEADRGVLGRLRPGDGVRFAVVSSDEARRANVQRDRDRASFLSGATPQL
jgi:KipI family sensor histidine kinase inhibitor